MTSKSTPTRTKRDRKRWTPRAKLAWHDVQRLAVEAVVAIETVRRWAAGDPDMRSMTIARINRAVNKLGVKLGAEPAGAA